MGRARQTSGTLVTVGGGSVAVGGGSVAVGGGSVAVGGGSVGVGVGGGWVQADISRSDTTNTNCMLMCCWRMAITFHINDNEMCVVYTM